MKPILFAISLFLDWERLTHQAEQASILHGHPDKGWPFACAAERVWASPAFRIPHFM
jgi:hypothetical protein